MKDPSIPPVSKAIQDLSPYQSARMLNAFDPTKIYLDANELPVPPDPMQIDFSALQHYAHSGPRRMIDAYADFADVAAENIVATRGIDEGIDLLIRAYLEPGEDSILITTPTYGMYSVCAAAHRVATIDVPLLELVQTDIDAIKTLTPLPKLIFLCRPNNPTGALMAQATVEAILELAAGRSIVAVDEAYIEFCESETLVPLQSKYPNLVILRTLSKGFGLAGIHTGFLIAHTQITEAVNRIANPYPIPEPCAQIAIDALGLSGLSRLRDNIASVISTRSKLLEALTGHPLCENVLPSHTNFLLSKWADPSDVLRKLTDRNILPRPVSVPGEALPRLRFSIGTEDQIDRVIDAIALC